jgi:hypothetical protein
MQAPTELRSSSSVVSFSDMSRLQVSHLQFLQSTRPMQAASVYCTNMTHGCTMQPNRALAELLLLGQHRQV